MRAELRSTSSSMATAAANVAMARVMPRTRTAGSPVTMPTARLAATPATRARAGGHPPEDRRAITNPATPANSWATTDFVRAPQSILDMHEFHAGHDANEHVVLPVTGSRVKDGEAQE